jgi:hypothetical protein
MYVRKLLAAVGCEQGAPTHVHEDNQACIVISDQLGTTRRTKHIQVRLSCAGIGSG